MEGNKNQNNQYNSVKFLLPGIPIYLTIRFVYRFQEFMKHWYVGGFMAISRQAVSLLEQLDRTFALQVTLRYIFEPLYQDRTVLGHILGFIFRSVRILLALVIYVVVLAVFTIIYFAWSILLPYALYRTAAAFNLINTISLWNL